MYLNDYEFECSEPDLISSRCGHVYRLNSVVWSHEAWDLFCILWESVRAPLYFRGSESQYLYLWIMINHGNQYHNRLLSFLCVIKFSLRYNRPIFQMAVLQVQFMQTTAAFVPSLSWSLPSLRLSRPIHHLYASLLSLTNRIMVKIQK